MITRLEQKIVIEIDQPDDINQFYELACLFWEYRNKAGIKQSFSVPKKYNEFLESMFAGYKPEEKKAKPNIDKIE